MLMNFQILNLGDMYMYEIKLEWDRIHRSFSSDCSVMIYVYREEDPRAMMEYLKSTIARMEEKMST